MLMKGWTREYLSQCNNVVLYPKFAPLAVGGQIVLLLKTKLLLNEIIKVYISNIFSSIPCICSQLFAS